MSSINTHVRFVRRKLPTLVFPPDFLWGAATSAYQVEGNADTRGRSIWDVFAQEKRRCRNGEHGNEACMHADHVVDDVRRVRDMGGNAYRFSLAWTRLWPDGDASKGVDPRGLAFYSKVLKAVHDHDMTPAVTLYHWDLPQALEDRGGWLSPESSRWFSDYAKAIVPMLSSVWTRLGGRSESILWITLNEPSMCCVLGYATGSHAPGDTSRPDLHPYTAARNMIVGHARAYRELRGCRGVGKVGIVLNCEWVEGEGGDKETAVERYFAFTLGWFADPIFKTGQYPKIMLDALGKRIPPLNADVKGTADFLGLNFYTSKMCKHRNVRNTIRSLPDLWSLFKHEPHGVRDVWTLTQRKSYIQDVGVITVPSSEWALTDMGWPVTPFGLTRMLCHLQAEYAPRDGIYVTENGCAVGGERSPQRACAMGVESAKRVGYLRSHVYAMKQAMERGVDVRGYFYWSLMDNFEWAHGYEKRFGAYHVDFQDPKRARRAKPVVIAFKNIAQKGRMEMTEEEAKDFPKDMMSPGAVWYRPHGWAR